MGQTYYTDDDAMKPLVGSLGHAMAVGDPESTERGSGARANGGKTPMHYIPIDTWLTLWDDAVPQDLYRVLELLGQWQEHSSPTAWIALESIPPIWMRDACDVFDYGAQKYSAWNWAKGMAWSIPVGCILRHARAIIEDGEHIDNESFCSHYGHIVCNLIMLTHYEQFYPEGDDRPPKSVFQKSGDDHIRKVKEGTQEAFEIAAASRTPEQAQTIADLIQESYD